MNRRDFLKNGSLASLLLLTGCNEDFLVKSCCQNGVSQDLAQEFTFVVAADPQPFWGAIQNWQQTVDEINKVSPDFVIVCGDMTNEPGNKEEIDSYWKIAKKLNPGIKLYNVPGNHDIRSNPKMENIELYKKNYGDLYYTFTHKNNLFIVFESTSMKNPNEDTAAWVEEQLNWLEKTLIESDSCNYSNKFVFLHHPIILEKEREEEQYFNLPVKLRKKLLKLFRKHGVRIAFSGHLHQDRVIKLKNIELVVTGSCGKALADSDLGFRIVKVSGKRITHNYFVLPDQTLRY